MPRQNLCTNPALSISTAGTPAGWATGGTGVRVTGLTGFVRTTGYRVSGTDYAQGAKGVAAAGIQYTASVYVKIPTSASLDLYIGWFNSGVTLLSDTFATTAVTGNVVTRLTHTATAPASTAYMDIAVVGLNTGETHDVTAAMYEAAASAGSYADGDTAGWAWDGTTGLSSSTEAAVADPLRLPIQTIRVP